MLNYQQPDAKGHFGPYGGTFVAETLVHALDELKAAYDQALQDPSFMAEFRHELKHFVGRPSPIYHAARLSREVGGAQIDVSGEEEVRLGRQRVERLQRGRPHRCAAECGAESFDRRLTRPTEWEVCRPTTGGRAGTHPSAPSISSRISRLNSSAYSIGSSLVKTSRNPWTIRFVASFSVMPRLIR